MPSTMWVAIWVRVATGVGAHCFKGLVHGDVVAFGDTDTNEGFIPRCRGVNPAVGRLGRFV